MGDDRLANVVGANHLFPEKNVLTIDCGTCIKFDAITQAGEYKGGAISLGLHMRFKALNYFTNALPLVEPQPIDFFIGDGVSGEEGNFDLYNYYTFFEFNFIVLIYYSLIENKKNLIWIKLLAVSFNLIYFISFYLSFLNLYTVQIEGFFNSLLIIIYFIELLNSEMVLNYKKIFPFWMSVGFLLFYLTSIPFFTLLYSKIFDNRLMFVLLYSIIIVLHLIFIYGLVTCKKAEN